jgi:hypothetical protein
LHILTSTEWSRIHREIKDIMSFTYLLCCYHLDIILDPKTKLQVDIPHSQCVPYPSNGDVLLLLHQVHKYLLNQYVLTQLILESQLTSTSSYS